MAISRQEALKFFRNVLKINEKVLSLKDPKLFFNSYAEKFTKRVPFTSAFDNYVMASKGHNWNDMMTDLSLLKKPADLWFNGMLDGKFGSSCQVAATFTKLAFEAVDLNCSTVISIVRIFPIPNIHSLVVAEDKEGEKVLIDLGNRLNPLPLSISMDLGIGEKSKVYEAGDTYTYLKRTGEKSFERWVGYKLSDDGRTILDEKIFCDFVLNDDLQFYDKTANLLDLTPLVNHIVQMKIPVELVLNYWTHNVPISGFSETDDRIVRVTNRKFEVQTEPRIGAALETFKVTSFDEYCKHVFEHFPRFENEQFISTMTNFWKLKYSDS